MQVSMLTKETIRDIATNKGAAAVSSILENVSDSSSVSFVLENLGQLPSGFDGEFLVELTNHKNANVRSLAVKNIAKLKKIDYFPPLKSIAKNDTNTMVRREAVSAIGRMRSRKNIDFLLEVLHDDDPKIVCQAIRALLVFKGEESVDSELKTLIDHDNEMVKSAIAKEYFLEESLQNRECHRSSDKHLHNIVVNGDTLEVMSLLKDESIHLTFTSPPYYNARDY